MMDVNKVQILVQEGEGLTVEFKEHFTPRIDEDIVAFANTKGGVILLGVRDDRTVRGEKLTNDMKARINSVARNCNPPVQVKTKQLQNIIAIEVPQGEDKPYNCSSGYFRRLDGTTQKMTNHELRIMFQEHEKISFEEKTNRSVSWKDISREKIRNFLKEADISIRKIIPQNILTSLSLVQKGRITKRDFGKSSVRRNPLIADLFNRMGKVERMGSGIERMRELMRDTGLKEPVFEMDAFFRVTFYRDPRYSLKTGRFQKGKGTMETITEKGWVERPEIKAGEKVGVKSEKIRRKLGEKLGENEKRILEIINKNKFITIPALSKTLDISTTAVENNLAKLKVKNILKRIGPDRGGHWEIVDV